MIRQREAERELAMDGWVDGWLREQHQRQYQYQQPMQSQLLATSSSLVAAIDGERPVISSRNNIWLLLLL